MHEFLNAARGKDIEVLVQEALTLMPSPQRVEEVPGFEAFRDQALSQYSDLLAKQKGVNRAVIRAQLQQTAAVRHIIEIGYTIRRYGYKPIVERFLPAFENSFFRERCRQFSNLVAYMGREEIERAPELLGLAILVLCSDMLVLSQLSYPDDFVADFLADLHERVKDIARRTLTNAFQQCPAVLTARADGMRLDSLPEFVKLRRQEEGTIRVNLGKGMPDLIAIVTAGGRSTRLQSIIPKPVIKFRGQYLIDSVTHSLQQAFSKDLAVFVGVGWESELTRACLGNRYRYLVLQPGEVTRAGHRGLGPGARLYAALLQLEPFDGPIIACYSDMPLVSPQSLLRLQDEFERGEHALCFLTSYNAPLPGHVIRNAEGQVQRIAHQRHHIGDASLERDVGFYMFRNTSVIREALGEVTNANIKAEYGIHQLVEMIAKRSESIGTVEISADECWTVNDAADLFWLATGLYRSPDSLVDPRDDYNTFRGDYGATFDYEWFAERRPLLRDLLNPIERPSRPVPLHFLTEFHH
jgi:molybdopterin-guanine dinucleotide biosynthesis protein A